MTSQSQVQQGAMFLSYGDVVRQIIKSKKAYKMTGNEAMLMYCFVEFMPRPKYITHLTAGINRSFTDWSDATGILRNNLTRLFDSLVAKKLILAFGDIGAEKTYFLHPIFADQLFRQVFVVHRPVNRKSNCHQSDDTTVIILNTNCHQSDDTTVIILSKNCHQSDDSDLYIEDPYSIPKESQLFPRRIPYCENSVDISEDVKSMARRVNKVSNDKEFSFSQAWVMKLIKSRIPLKDIDEFISKFEEHEVRFLSAAERDKTFVLWRSNRLNEDQEGLMQ